MAATLWIPFLAACQTPIKVGAPPPPSEFLTCQEEPEKPVFKPLEVHTGPMGGLFYKVADVDARDAQIAPYVLLLRGSWFSCYNDVEAIREYYEAQD